MPTTMLMKLCSPGKLPYITLYHGKEPYRFVIDTGSTLSWTTHEVAGKMLLGEEVKTVETVINTDLESATQVTLRAEPVTGTESDNTAQKFQVKLWCGTGTEKINEMNVHVDEPLHGILGVDFLLHNGAHVDMDRKLLYL